MKNVLVLGASGMLGSMVVDILSQDSGLAVTASVREPQILDMFKRIYPNVRWERFVFSGNDAPFTLLDGQDWIINAIGITKPLISDNDSGQVKTAILVNSLMPYYLGRAADKYGGAVLQIATDCVFSGAKGSYVEADTHDALDVYGKTKSLGETVQQNVHHLRCSIIGPEPKDFKFLIEWFRRQPRHARVNGFTNHNWNGVTTLHFALICKAIIASNVSLPHLQHVVPASPMTKAQMLREFATAYNRQDIVVNDVEAKSVIDRTLATNDAEMNAELWRVAGYLHPPTVSKMIQELGSYKYSAATMAAAT